MRVRPATHHIPIGIPGHGGPVYLHPDGSTATANANPLMSSTGNATTTPVGTTTGTRSYSVLDGDTMTSISMKMYGSTLQQDKIYNANLQQIPDRDHLITGTVLSIPE
jgi:nucleoid-associated protein YgaU